MPIPLVNPGELTLSRSWNDLAALVNNMEVRLAQLEKGGTGLRITQVLPPGVVTAGDTIRISGSGFVHPWRPECVFGSAARLGSARLVDSLLIVKVRT